MMLVDVHAHMDFSEFGGKNIDIDAVMKRCIGRDVAAVVSQGVNKESNRKVLELSSRYGIIKAALGIYPTHCMEISEENIDSEIGFIDSQLGQKKAIAVGEVGLDYKEIEPTEENKQRMKSALRKFCELAKKHDVPIILHSRKAELDTIELLSEMQMKKVIMHCFSGRSHLVKRVVDNGWFLSIPANITKLEHFQYIARDVPISQLLTETDSPYLSPTDEINDPSNVIYAIRKIAQIKGLTEEETANIIYNNYQRMFL